jgi:hypothetical protein
MYTVQISQCLGVLGVQRCVWARRVTKLLYRADVDGRAHTSWVRVYGECSLLGFLRSQAQPHFMQFFWFIWTVESLRVNYWAEFDPGDNQQAWKQLEGLSILVCSQCSWMSRGLDWHKRAEREARGGAVGHGEAKNR